MEEAKKGKPENPEPENEQQSQKESVNQNAENQHNEEAENKAEENVQEEQVEVEGESGNENTPELTPEEAVAKAERENTISEQILESVASKPEIAGKIETGTVGAENDNENKVEEQAADTTKEEESALTEEKPATETKEQPENTEDVTAADAEPDADETETPDEKEVFEEPDFSTFTKEELVTYIEKAGQDSDIFKFSRAVRNARQVFDAHIDQEREAMKAKFLEDPEMKEEDFAPPADPLREKMVTAYRTYQKQKKELTTKLKEERENNLKAKQEILERMREITESLSKANHFNDFRKLQDEFRNVGPVPREHAEKLYESFRFQRDKFFDNLSMYEELKDLDRKKNLESKEEILQKINDLEKIENVNEAVNQLRNLQAEWRKAGPVPKDNQDEINEKYKEATSKIYTRKEGLDKEMNELRAKNFEAKTEILNKIKELLSDIDSPEKNWKKSTEKLDKWVEEWKKVGPVPAENRTAIQKEFNTTIREFSAARNNFFKEKKKERVQNLQEKTALCERAEQLLQEPEPQKHKQEVIQLQEKWKEIGPVPNKFSDKIWERFHTACDSFFGKLTQEHSKALDEQKENLKKKEELVGKINELAKAENPENLEEQVKAIQEEWNQIGFVPFKAKETIREKYQKALGNLMKGMKVETGSSPEGFNYRLQLESMKQSNDSRKKLENEEKFLVRELRRLENEASTLENNMEFFRNSKGAEALKKDVENKVSKLHEKMDQLKEKLKILKDVVYSR